MKVLVLGGGAREHAICWSLASSTLITKLYCAPGNPGIEKEALCVDLDIKNNKEVLDFAKKNKIDLVVPGPEIPLVNGIVDELKQNKIRAFGPSKAAALLEGSKKFTKDICNSAIIPTAKFKSAVMVEDKEHLLLINAVNLEKIAMKNVFLKAKD